MIIHPYEINWHGPVNAELGYCRHNREIVKALVKQGLTIHLTTSDGRKSKYAWFWKALSSPQKTKLITVFCTPQTWLYPKIGYGIIYTTVESNTLHDVAIHRTKCFQEVWVPSEFNKEVFKKYKFGNVHVIPEGIDPEFWNCSHIKTDDTFKFITLADWSYRKGVKWLLQAFSLAFKKSDNVKLIMLTRKAAHEGKKYTKEIMKEAGSFVKDVGGSLNKVEFYTMIMTDEEIRDSFRKADCFVLPSLGEAWCLPAEEAMACELPCILPKVGGHRYFASKKTGWLTSGYWSEMPKSHVLLYNGQLFYHPDLKSLISAFKHAYKHPLECRKKGEYARRFVTTNVTWDRAAEKAVKRIGEIYNKGYDPERRGKCFI
jgi:glycosyltransferase involved in cell wall biosynthesis